MNLEIQSTPTMYPQAACYKPRRLSTYVYTPRSKVPPNWQRAQSFVRALVIQRIGQRPYFSQWPIEDIVRYQKEYVRVREEYRMEDFPINP